MWSRHPGLRCTRRADRSAGAVWGLAAYGSDGVQAAMQMIQRARTARGTMGLCGKPKLAMLDRTMVRFSKH